jgi:F0F1-type ATP synthase membrane subunit b/b'
MRKVNRVKTKTRIQTFLTAALLACAAPAMAQHGPDPHKEGNAPVGAQGAPEDHGAAGGHGEHHGIDPKTLAFQLVNFGLLVTILVVFGGKGINRTLKARHDQLKADLEDAARARATAEARLKEQDQRVANLETELARLRTSMTQDAQQEKAKLTAAAEERVRRIQAETQAMLAQQVRDAERRFREEVGAAALQIAEEKVRRALQIDDEQRLLQSFVGELENGSAAGAGRAA